MVATWSDFEGSSESESEDGQAHVCLMANNDDYDDIDKNHKEVRDYLNTCSKMNQLQLSLICFKLKRFKI